MYIHIYLSPFPSPLRTFSSRSIAEYRQYEGFEAKATAAMSNKYVLYIYVCVCRHYIYICVCIWLYIICVLYI